MGGHLSDKSQGDMGKIKKKNKLSTQKPQKRYQVQEKLMSF